MNFEMDEQSYRDLNIFRTTENAFSLFDLFKKTKTVGGRALIEQWMRIPSNQLADLQKRSEAIAFLNGLNFSLKINNNQFDLTLHYLNYERGYLKANLIDSFYSWIANRIVPNQHYYVVQIGIRHLLDLIKYSNYLTSDLIEPNAPSLIFEIISKMKALLSLPAISFANSLASRPQLNFYELGRLDSLFRHENRLVILDLLNLFYTLDALEALKNVVNEQQFCLPGYVNDQDICFEVKELFHPAFATPLKNDINITAINNLIFLSGSNMAGKSSLLKAVGTAFYLAHIGFPIPAKSLKASIFDGIITTINLADAIENGLSHYYSEVMRVKKVASLLAEKKKMFIILDELFKGTNAKDAFDASLLVINGFSEIPNSIFIISSHITELASDLNAKNIDFRYMEHLMINGKPKFTYQLKSGVARDGIGMYFIEKENIIGLLARARKSSQ